MEKFFFWIGIFFMALAYPEEKLIILGTASFFASFIIWVGKSWEEK